MKLYLKCTRNRTHTGSIPGCMGLQYEKTMPANERQSLYKYDKAPKRHLSTTLKSYSHIQWVQKRFFPQKRQKPRMVVNHHSYHSGYCRLFKWVLTYLLSLLDLAAVAFGGVIHTFFPFSKLLIISSKRWSVLS